ARTSTLSFKDRQSTIADISHGLGVAYVLEGSVRTAGNRLRVSAQLVQADSGFQVWSQTYERNLDDPFKLQGEIAQAVAESMKATLAPAPGPDLASAGAAPAVVALWSPGKATR